MTKRPRIITLVFVALALLVSVYLILVAFQVWALRHFVDTYPKPGQLVDVDGYNMHLKCSGSGARTIILEAGAGSWSMDWYLVQSELSKVARVCSYDRAGTGWSDRRPEPRDINRLVSELDSLLRKALVKPPYIMVGASFGGMIVQLFENRYPDLVTALVLIDGRPKDYFERYEKIVPNSKERLIEEMKTITFLYGFGLLAAVVNSKPPEGVPATLQELYLDHGRMTKQAIAWAKERIDGADNEQLAHRIGHIGDKPLLVISHGKKNMFAGRSGLSTSQAASLEALFASMQLGLTDLSTNSRHVIAEQSGHAIQFDQPDLIVREVSRLIAID